MFNMELMSYYGNIKLKSHKFMENFRTIGYYIIIWKNRYSIITLTYTDDKWNLGKLY